MRHTQVWESDDGASPLSRSMPLRFRFDFTSSSLRFHLGSLSLHFAVTSLSSLVQFHSSPRHSDFTTISPRSHFDCTSICYFAFISTSLQSHFNLTLVSLTTQQIALKESNQRGQWNNGDEEINGKPTNIHRVSRVCGTHSGCTRDAPSSRCTTLRLISINKIKHQPKGTPSRGTVWTTNQI